MTLSAYNPATGQFVENNPLIPINNDDLQQWMVDQRPSVAAWATVTRPSLTAGQIVLGFNTDTASLEIGIGAPTGSAWQSLGGWAP